MDDSSGNFQNYKQAWIEDQARNRFLQVLTQLHVWKTSHPYCLRWVSELIRLDFPDSLSDDEILTEFNCILQNRDIEDWQRRQALASVRLWLRLFPDMSATASDAQEILHAPQSAESKNWNTDDANVTDRESKWQELTNRMCILMQRKRYSERSCETYLQWWVRLKNFVVKNPDQLSESDISRFLDFLVVSRHVAAPTQNQALNAVNMLWIWGLGHDELSVRNALRAPPTKRLPFVLSKADVLRIIATAGPLWSLLIALAYGCGLRLNEALSLRIKDLDFDRGLLIVHGGKGDKDRSLPIPKKLIPDLHVFLKDRKVVYLEDLGKGHAEMDLPGALATKYPAQASAWEWQYVFASKNLLKNPRSGKLMRWHHLDSTVQKAFRRICAVAGISPLAHFHTLRHCYATHLLESGVSIREIQERLGHARLETTMVYTHVRSPSSRAAGSPLDDG